MTDQQVRRLAPEFSLPTPSGEVINFKQGTGRVAVVVFTCNHCPYALAWHDRIQAVISDYRDLDVDAFQVNANDVKRVPLDAPEEMARRIDAGEFASPYLIDETQAAAHAWEASVTPHVFVVDRQGIICYQGAPDGDYGDPNLNALWLRGAIDAALAGDTTELADTKPVGCTIKWKQ